MCEGSKRKRKSRPEGYIRRSRMRRRHLVIFSFLLVISQEINYNQIVLFISHHHHVHQPLESPFLLFMISLILWHDVRASCLIHHDHSFEDSMSNTSSWNDIKVLQGEYCDHHKNTWHPLEMGRKDEINKRTSEWRWPSRRPTRTSEWI